jgi:hypothetical protein
MAAIASAAVAFRVTATKAGVVRGEGPDLGRFRRVHPHEDLVRLLVGQLLDDVGGVVRIDVFEELGGLVGRERAKDAGRFGGIELLEELRDLLVGQPLEQDRDLVGLELRDDVRPLRRTDGRSEAADAFLLALADELLHLGEKLAGVESGGHAGTRRRAPARGPWTESFVMARTSSPLAGPSRSVC